MPATRGATNEGIELYVLGWSGYVSIETTRAAGIDASPCCAIVCRSANLSDAQVVGFVPSAKECAAKIGKARGCRGFSGIHIQPGCTTAVSTRPNRARVDGDAHLKHTSVVFFNPSCIKFAGRRSEVWRTRVPHKIQI